MRSVLAFFWLKGDNYFRALENGKAFPVRTGKKKFQFSRIPPTRQEAEEKNKSMSANSGAKWLRGIYRLAIIVLFFSIFSGFHSKEISSSPNWVTWEKIALEMEGLMGNLESPGNASSSISSRIPSLAMKNLIEIGILGKSEGTIEPEEGVKLKDLSSSWARFFAYLTARFPEKFFSSVNLNLASSTFIPEWIMCNDRFLYNLIKGIPTASAGEESTPELAGKSHIDRLKDATILLFSKKETAKLLEKNSYEAPNQGLAALRAQLKREKNSGNQVKNINQARVPENQAKIIETPQNTDSNSNNNEIPEKGKNSRLDKSDKREKPTLVSSDLQKGVFKGQIIDALTGKPIHNAVLLAEGRIEKVDQNGCFSISSSSHKQIAELLITADGYAGLELKHNFGSKRCKEFSEIRLNPLFSVFKGNMLSSENGKIIEKGTIKIGEKSFLTDKLGRFCIPKLRPGYYPVEFSSPGYNSRKELIFIEETSANRTIRLSQETSPTQVTPQENLQSSLQGASQNAMSGAGQNISQNTLQCD
ncbi:MAG: carboxypeptidase regulatory-like domain-containing protein [Candidatus Riflebacteria bacterium]|nr:carboxypeptidase regulatory-like domain-containing protein [Candidatus Riflebacteria bacterium]